MSEAEYEYPCLGVCMADPDSGYCLGCGRPPLPVSISQKIVAGQENQGTQNPLNCSLKKDEEKQ
ncbi:hypothetical protein [Propionivibrio sp.]|uniref:hypothetical protein n=1 Tax=Propionivibrio sp. TaxID=2212460 RepID=UPI003BF18527